MRCITGCKLKTFLPAQPKPKKSISYAQKDAVMYKFHSCIYARYSTNNTNPFKYWASRL